MEILLVQGNDDPTIAGGTGTMLTLAGALRAEGVSSKILCADKGSNRSDVFQLPKPNLTERGLRFFTSRIGLNDIHRLSSFRVRKLPLYRDADLIQFHGTHSGTLSYLALPELTRRKPGVFVLSDAWAMTGHCAVFYDCERWKHGCGRCPNLSENPAARRDATRIEWRLKNWAWRHSRMHFVAPSRWMKTQAERGMLRHYPIHHIPHGLDTEAYRPMDREQARSALGIGRNRKVLLTVASDLRRPAKGMNLLVSALRDLPASLKSELLLLTMGRAGNEFTSACGVEVMPLGVIGSTPLKALCYNAADLYVLPSRSESFGRVILESMACGTPVVAFDVTAVPELVRPEITGLLARPEDSADLHDQILSLIEDRERRERMGEHSRTIAVTEYDHALQAKRYAALYRQILTDAEPARSRPFEYGESSR